MQNGESYPTIIQMTSTLAMFHVSLGKRLPLVRSGRDASSGSRLQYAGERFSFRGAGFRAQGLGIGLG